MFTRLFFAFIVLAGSGCGVKNPAKITQDNSAVRPACTEIDCQCSQIAMNQAGNIGLWGGKSSFRATLPDEVWGKFVREVKSANLDPSCEKYVLWEAENVPEGKPVTLNLIWYGAKVIMGSKK